MTLKFFNLIAISVRLPEREEEEYAGVIYGSIPGKHLIIGGFSGVEFSEQQELIVKTTLENHVIGFWVKVEKRIDEEEPVYFVSFPKQVEQLDLRKTERLNVLIPAEVEISVEGDEGGAPHVFRGVMVDLSPNGCCFNSEQEWPENARCVVRFQLPGAGQLLTLEGQVVRRKEKKDTVGQVGLEFGPHPENDSSASAMRRWLADNRQFLVL